MKFNATKINFLAALIFISIPAFVFALPEGESVVAGSATFDRSQANTLTVSTPSDKLIVNYNSFNIAQPETVNFQQPSAASIVLNRVVGLDPSSIMGTLNANGRVFIVNPNGVIFGPSSHVDVAGLVASSLNISNEDFMNGNYVFTRSGKNGYVINEGTIKAQAGGYVCLLGGAVDNRLAIQAELGTVVLASGEKITVSLEDQNAISVVVDEAVQSEVFGPDGVKMTSAVKNSGTILAEGGKVMLTAKVLNRVFDHAINNTGLVKVTSLVEKDGVIELVAEGAPIVNSGTLEAGRVYIKGSNADLINTPEGKIIVNAVSAQRPDGGKVSIQATSVLQQGLISANALEQGTAGEVIIVSEGTATLDESSCTEARAMGIVGNGGRITITSKTANVFVNKNAKIDFSAGAIAGNGGLVKVDAFKQLGFYGILNGRAPPGFTAGTAYLDPESATIGTPEATTTISANTTVDAWGDITILGNIYLSYNTTLNLYADHQDQETWDTTYSPGTGAIINAGDYTITGDDWGGILNLRAGSGIGSMTRPIQTNIGDLSATIGPYGTGDIFIDQGDAPLDIRGISSPGLVVLTSLGIVREYYDISGMAITADELYIEAEGGISGDEEDLFSLSVNKLAVVNFTSGDIRIENNKDLVVLAAVNNAPQGSTYIRTTAGDLRIRYGVLSSGPVELEAYNNLYVNTIANITSSAAITVSAVNGAIIRRNMEVLDYGLLAYWDFNQSYSYYYAQDVSGNGYSAYCSGTPDMVAGIAGQALYFDGVSDYINLGRNLNLGAGPFTLICWYQGTQSLNNVGLMGSSPSPYTAGFAMETQYGALQSWVNNDMDVSSVLVNDGYWHQLAIVRNGTSGSLSVFGQEEPYMTEFTTSDASVDTTGNFWIGGWGHMRRLTQGNLDDVRVYASALSGFEIYAQTLIQPGSGQISGSSVSLSAAAGIGSASAPVQTATAALTAANTGTGDIYIANSGDVRITNVDPYADGIHNAGGSINLQAMSSIVIANDISTDLPGASIYIYASDDITVNTQVSVGTSIGSDYNTPIQNAVSGNVTLSAGRNITLNYGASVYSSANGSGPAYDNSATSGFVSILAGGAMTLDWVHIYSDASATASETAIAVSGPVTIDAGGSLTITQGSDIYSDAAATVNYGLEGSYARAESGAVDLSAGTGLSVNGTGQGYGANIYSTAYAYAGSQAYSYTSTVSFFTTSGDISLSNTEVRSYAQSLTSIPNGANSNSSAYAGDQYYDSNYEWSYLAVMIDAGGSVILTDGTQVYGYATAQGEAAQAYARAGDVIVDAAGNISLSEQYIYSEALSYAYTRAESVSGELTIASMYGAITIPSTVQSNASADVRSAGGEAYATSDDIDVHSWFGSADVYAADSTAEAYSSVDNVIPGLVQATAGDVTLYAYQTLDFAYAYSQATSSSTNATTARLTAGDVNLSASSIDVSEVYAYSSADATASSYAYATAGSINVFTSGAFNFLGELYSYARAYGPVGASATSGAIYIDAYGDISVVGYLYSYAYAEAASGYYPTAYSSSISMYSGGTLDLQIYSEEEGMPQMFTAAVAYAGESSVTYGDVTLYGDDGISVNNDIGCDDLTMVSYYGSILVDVDEYNEEYLDITGSAYIYALGNLAFDDDLTARDIVMYGALITTGSLIASSGNIDVEGQSINISGEVSAAAGSVDLISAGALTVAPIEGYTEISALYDVTIEGVSDVVLYAYISSEDGNVTVNSEEGSITIRVPEGAAVDAAGNIEITSWGNITLYGGAAADGDLTITSESGSFTGPATQQLYLYLGGRYITISAANDFTLDSGDGILMLNTDVFYSNVSYGDEEWPLTLNLTATGDHSITVSDDMEFTNDLVLNAGGSLTMAEGTALNAGYISLISGMDMTLWSVISGTDLYIQAWGGLFANDLAGSSIYAYSAGSMTVSELVSGYSEVVLESGADMELADVTSGSGIEIDANGSVSVSGTLTAEEGSIDVSAGESLEINGVDTPGYLYAYAFDGTMSLSNVYAGSFVYAYSSDNMTAWDINAQDSINLYSDGDLAVYGNMNAPLINLSADNDSNGEGTLQGDGEVTLSGQNFYFRSAGDFVINEAVNCGNFSAYLDAGNNTLQTLMVESTNGSITVDSPIVREDSGVVQLEADQDIILNAPITTGLAYISLISSEGSILAGEALEGPAINSASNVYLSAGYYYQEESGSVIASLEYPLDVAITGEGNVIVSIYGEVEGISGALTGTTPSGTIIVDNVPPGIVYFNGIDVNAEPAPEPQPEPTPEPEAPVAPVDAIISNQPTVVNPAALETMQISSTIGTVYFYHPIAPTDMGAIDALSLGADAYQLQNGELQLIGHEGLLQFFQEFDEKNKQL